MLSWVAMRRADPSLLSLVRAIVRGEDAAVSRLLARAPDLCRARFASGATRQAAKEHFFDEIRHYVYAGDTALHLAAAAYRPGIVRKLLRLGADAGAKNRRGAEALHYAVDGGPGSPSWNPRAQATTIAVLLGAGADPNAVDQGGVTPLHRAVRNRCAAAVATLLEGGADRRRRNRSGSTPIELATRTSGRGGSGSPEAKEQQKEILRLLRARSSGHE